MSEMLPPSLLLTFQTYSAVPPGITGVFLCDLICPSVAMRMQALHSKPPGLPPGRSTSSSFTWGACHPFLGVAMHLSSQTLGWGILSGGACLLPERRACTSPVCTELALESLGNDRLMSNALGNFSVVSHCVSFHRLSRATFCHFFFFFLPRPKCRGMLRKCHRK